MAYVASSDIQDEFKSIDFTASPILTTAKVNKFISQEEATLNAKLGKRYKTPITGTNAILVVQGLSTKLVKGRCLDILQVKSGDTKTDQGVTGDSLRKQVWDLVDLILGKTMDLDGAELSTPGDGVSDFNSSDSCVEHTFKRNRTQW